MYMISAVVLQWQKKMSVQSYYHLCRKIDIKEFGNIFHPQSY